MRFSHSAHHSNTNQRKIAKAGWFITHAVKADITVVDGTGVGEAVTDIVRSELPNTELWSVVITGGKLRENQVLFTYLHLAPDEPQTRGLMDSGCIAIAYETVTNSRGGLPLLAPMSEVAGRMSIQVGAHCLEKEQEIGRAHV